jgi:hypothetical protein
MWSEPLSRRGRTLSTAREVLRVLRFLQTHPEGVKLRTVAAYLGKSPHTAYYRHSAPLPPCLWIFGRAPNPT